MAVEKELLQAIHLLSQGKEEGFNTFYSCTYNYVYSRAKLLMKNEEDALDLTQETFIQAYKGINSLEDANNVYAWLRSIAYRQGMRIFRKKKEFLITDEGEEIFDVIVSQDTSGNPEDAAQQKVTSEIVMGMIEELPELQKAAVLAFYYDNMKIDDIAGIFECSANTIKSRLNYAKKALKAKVEAHEKANRYKLCSLSPAVLFLACKSLFATEKYTLSEASVQAVYTASCDAVGLSTEILPLPGAAIADISTSTLTTKTGLTIGAKIGIGIVTLGTVGAITASLFLHNTRQDSVLPSPEPEIQEAIIENTPTPEPTSTPKPLQQATHLTSISDLPGEPTPVPADFVDFVIDFPDPILFLAMQDTTGIRDRDILYSDIQYMTVLKIQGGDIFDISGLEYITSLKTLDLSNNKISDISALGNLVNLQKLVLTGNPIEDYSPVEFVPNLIK